MAPERAATRPHQLRLFDHLSGERPILLPRLIDDDAERRLERVREIADMSARPLHDL